MKLTKSIALTFYLYSASSGLASEPEEYKVVISSYNKLEQADRHMKKLSDQMDQKHVDCQKLFGKQMHTRQAGKAYIIALEPFQDKKSAYEAQKVMKQFYVDAYVDSCRRVCNISKETNTSDLFQKLDSSNDVPEEINIPIGNMKSETETLKDDNKTIAQLLTKKMDVDAFLEKFIQDSIINSPTIVSKVNALQAASYNEEGAKWEYFPTPTLSTEQGKAGQRTTTARLQQPLWAGGRIDAGYDKAKSQTKAAQMSIEEVQQNVVISISQALNSVISSYGRMLVQQNALKRLEMHKAMILRRIEHGISPQSELFLVDSRLTQTKTDLSIAEASVQKSMASLQQWIERKITLEELKPILPDALCETPLADIVQTEHIYDKAIETNPGLKRFDYQIEAARKDVEIKKAVFMPNVYAKVEKQWYSATVDSTNYNIGLQYAPGAGLSSVSAFESAQATLFSLIQDKKAYEYELRQKVISETSDYDYTIRRYENYKAAVDTTQKTTESYERLFIAGKRSWLDVLNAEREWVNAELTLSDIQAYLSTVSIRLKQYADTLNISKGSK